MPRGYRVPYRKLPGSVSRRGQPSSTQRTMPTPPPSCNPHFLLIEYAHSWEGPILYVACRSDVACHLWLRWTDKPMGMHNRVTTLGGYKFMTDPKYCLVEYNDIEQNEAGDTEYHTFTFPGWAECNWRWWYLIGTLAGEPSPSATCIFQAHYLDQERADSLKHTDLIEKEVDGVIDHADGSVTPAKLLNPFYRLVQFIGHGRASYGVVWSGTYNVLTILVSSLAVGTPHRLYMAFNTHMGATDYDTLAVLIEQGAALGNYEFLGKNFLPLVGNDVDAGHPLTYKATVPLLVDGGGDQNCHFSSSHDTSAGTVQVLNGVHIYRKFNPINRIDIWERLNRDFSCRITVLGA